MDREKSDRAQTHPMIYTETHLFLKLEVKAKSQSNKIPTQIK